MRACRHFLEPPSPFLIPVYSRLAACHLILHFPCSPPIEGSLRFSPLLSSYSIFLSLLFFGLSLSSFSPLANLQSFTSSKSPSSPLLFSPFSLPPFSFLLELRFLLSVWMTFFSLSDLCSALSFGLPLRWREESQSPITSLELFPLSHFFLV